MKLSTSTMVKIAVLSAISVPLMLLDFPLPIFASFLKIDLSDLPAVVGGLSLGPAAAVFIELIKNLVKLTIKNDTGGIGELANFLVGSAYAVPLAFVCLKKKNKRRFVCGAALGTISMAIVAAVMNYYVLIPLYSTFMPIEAIIEMGAKVNGAIHDTFTLILFSVVPFNIIKAVVLSITGYWLYKLLKRFL